ncbi:MAG: hypothetical protein LBE56_04145 [Tannerella sp.]|jgi:hypothetical protein|nr:hypothetical protein [Tannerella sp.]
MKAIKNIKLHGFVLLCVSAFMLTSCMEGEQGNRESGQLFGVVRFDEKSLKNVLDVSGFESFYSSLFTNEIEGNCFLVNYELDYDLPENSFESISTNGYITVQIADRISVPSFSLFSTVQDTATVLTSEVPIIESIYDITYSYNFYIKGMFFLISTLEAPSDQRMNWILSYDPEQLTTEENGFRYYDLFLRSTIRVEGEETAVPTAFANGFDMKSYLEMVVDREKSLGSTSASTFRLRIHFPSAISEDGKLTWKYQDTRDIQLGFIVPETTTP